MNKHIVYQGIEYDVGPFLQHHPGGANIIQHFISLKSDITEVFKSTHSMEAEHKLLAMRVINKTDRAKLEKVYCKIQERMKRFYPPTYFNEILYTLIIISFFIFSIWTQNSSYSVAAIAIVQILTAWVSHSQLHKRNRFLNFLAISLGGSVLGLSASWWKQKHQKHHLFTNHDALDEDISTSYSVYLYPLMLFKWRLQSLCWSLLHLEFKELLLIFIHYCMIYQWKVALPLLIGVAWASVYLALISQGNHQQQKRFKNKQFGQFLTEKIESTRNYQWKGWIWGIILGGFNYHTEHHLFPKIPFYKLDEAHRILVEELEIYKKNVETGNILF